MPEVAAEKRQVCLLAAYSGFTYLLTSLSLVYFAAQEGHLACIHWLVEHAQADPQLHSTDGMTPLHAAAQTGRLNVTHWLVRSANCPITCKTSDGATPVHFAAAKGAYISTYPVN